MIKGIIYNLMIKTHGKESSYYIETYDGWLDEERDIGYYKNGTYWYITETATGRKMGDNHFKTRKDAVAVVERSYWYVEKYKNENPEKYNSQKEQFQQELKKYKEEKNGTNDF